MPRHPRHFSAPSRAQRISLPRRCTPTERHARLRRALCRATTVRATWFQLDAPAQDAMRALSAMRGGIAPDALVARFGALRSWRHLAADPRPRTITEHLVLRGWLLPRPATPRHPARFLVPPELRRWLPQPLAVASLGHAPAAPPVPVLRATVAILLASATRPLPLRATGTLRRGAERLLGARLAPWSAADVLPLLAWLVPLLHAAGLLETRMEHASITLAGQRFLRESPAVQRDQLRHAWLHMAQPDALIARLLPTRAGMDWPLLRRKLCTWVAALPADQLLDPATLYPTLAQTFGPLADAHTHGFRAVRRTPWGPRRAAAVFAAALHGPLRWLGYVADGTEPRTKNQEPNVVPSAESRFSGSWFCHTIYCPSSFVVRPSSDKWRYGPVGDVVVPHAAADADVLRLLPFARWQAADADATTYRIMPETLAAAARQGWDAGSLWALLDRRAGPPPDAWHAALPAAPPRLDLRTATLLLADEPALLGRAMRARSVQRAVARRLAPGIALVQPEHVAPLQRALERQHIAIHAAVQHPARAATTVPWSPGDCAALALACAFYRRHAPPAAPLLPGDDLAARLRHGLPPALQHALDDAAAGLDAVPAPPPIALPAPHLAVTPLSIGETMQQLRRAIAAQQPLTISYTTANAAAPAQRIVRPLALEQRHGCWYLRAACMLRRAERTFRVDRISAITRMPGRTSGDRPESSVARPTLIWLE